MKKKALILVNLLIVVLEVIAFILSFDDFGINLITYYTQYSNLLALFSSIVLLLCLIRNHIPSWVRFLRYITATLLCVTFLVVASILAPLIGEKGYMMFTYSSMLYHHLLCPILFLISFIFLEKGCPITKKDPLYCLIPTLAYGSVMIILNIIGLVEGPYPFFVIGLLPMYLNIFFLISIVVLAYLTGVYIFKLSSKRNEKIAN